MADNNKWQEAKDAAPPRAGDAPDYQAEIEKIRSEMAHLADAVTGTVKTTMKPVARELEATVSRNPTASVLIAAGIGLVLGVMMSRS